MIHEVETIINEDWQLKRTNKDGIYLYEFFHKPHDEYCPMGRYCKFVQEGEEIIVIEDGPYYGN